MTTTDANGNLVVVTFFPGGQASEIVLQTSTDAGGQRKTITSYRAVQPSTTSTAPAATSTGPSATLAAGMASAKVPLAFEHLAVLFGLLSMLVFF